MMTVRNVMTRPAFSVRRETPVREVAELLVQHSISGVPVVDVDGAVLGVVSEGDLLVKEQGRDAVPHRRLARLFGESRETQDQLAKLVALTAAEAMTAPAVTIEPSRPVSEAAALMIARHVHRLPVVDDGRLVGIVTRADLVRAYVRSDEELARSIRDDVLLPILWLDPNLFTVTVKDGVAAISGRVLRHSTAEMLQWAVAMVPGIVEVQADVTWTMEDRQIELPSQDPVFPFGSR